MELAKIETKNPYRLALTTPKFMEVKKGEAVKILIEIITKCYYDLGQNVPGYDTKSQAQTLQILSGATYEEIKTYFSFIRTEEIRIAFTNGVRKEYGEFFGVNVATFHAWLKAFQADQRRKEAIAAQKESEKIPVKPICSPTEAEYGWKQAMYAQFEDYKKTGILKCEFPAYQFKEFKKRGLIKLNETEYELILDQAKDKVSELHRLKRLNPKSVMERNKSTKAINEIASGVMSTEIDSQVKNEARRIAIANYYAGIEKLEL